MKKIIILVLLLMAISTTSMAAMYITSPAQVGITHYYVVGLGTFVTNPVAAKADGSLDLNVSEVPTGTYSATVQSCTGWDDCATPARIEFRRIFPNAAVPTLTKKA